MRCCDSDGLDDSLRRRSGIEDVCQKVKLEADDMNQDPGPVSLPMCILQRGERYLRTRR